MGVDYGLILAYSVGIILLFILGRLLLVPMKVLLKLLYNALVGGIVLILINYIGGLFGFHIALNIFSSLIAGMLGIPGLILLILIKLIFNA